MGDAFGRNLVLAVIATCALGALAGCGGGQGKVVRAVPSSGINDLSEAPVLSAPGRGGLGIEAGLEVGLVASTADRRGIGVALAPYLDDPTTVDAELRGLWNANGLRVARVPLSDWPAVSGRLKLSGATQRQWMSPASGWVEVVRGPERPRGQTIALDAERLELPPGRLRMLARCWCAPVAPVTGDGAATNPTAVSAQLVVELLPQHAESESTSNSLRLSEPRGRGQDPLDAGLAFSRLLFRFSVRGSDPAAEQVEHVMLLIPERPGVDWRALAESESDSSGEATEGATADFGTVAPRVGEVVRGTSKSSASGTGPSGSPGGAAWMAGAFGDGAGPIAPTVPTLGESLFGIERGPVSADGEQREPTGARALVVLVPRVPAAFRLLPTVTRGTP